MNMSVPVMIAPTMIITGKMDGGEMIFDVELHCDKWKDCKTKWCNGDGGFWCNEDCKLLQVNSPSNQKKVEKILSNGDAVYVLYVDGTWRKNEKK